MAAQIQHTGSQKDLPLPSHSPYRLYVVLNNNHMKIIQISEGVFRYEGEWNSIYELIELLEWNGKLFVQSKKASDLYQYIRGYNLSLELNKIVQRKDMPPFSWFTIWLFGRLEQSSGATADWVHHLLENSNHDEEKAYEDFFMFFKEFKSATLSFEIAKAKRNMNDPYVTWPKNSNCDQLLEVRLSGSDSSWIIEIGNAQNNRYSSPLYGNQCKIKLQGYEFSSEWTSLSEIEGIKLLKENY